MRRDRFGRRSALRTRERFAVDRPGIDFSSLPRAPAAANGPAATFGMHTAIVAGIVRTFNAHDLRVGSEQVGGR